MIDEAKSLEQKAQEVNQNRELILRDGDDIYGKLKTDKKLGDYFKSKDKWKVGNQLKELRRMFPHDRVL